MSAKKPTPIVGERDKKICPICGRRAYSAAGIHPQCAVLQADAPREKKLKQAKAIKAKKKTKAASPGQIPWNKKKCPKCRAVMHVRKKICDCGHTVGGAK